MNHSHEEAKLAHVQGEVLSHELEFPDGRKLHEQIKKTNMYFSNQRYRIQVATNIVLCSTTTVFATLLSTQPKGQALNPYT